MRSFTLEFEAVMSSLLELFFFFPWKKFLGKREGRLDISVLQFVALENS